MSNEPVIVRTMKSRHRIVSTYAPNSADNQESIQSTRGHTGSVRVEHEMGIVESREKTPATIDLRVVLVNLRHDEEDRSQEQ